MKGLRKCLSYVPLFALLSSVLFLSSSNDVRAAYSPSVPELWATCEPSLINEKVWTDEPSKPKNLSFFQAAYQQDSNAYNKFRSYTHYIVQQTSGSLVTVTAINADELIFEREDTLPNRYDARFLLSTVPAEYVTMQGSISSQNGYVTITENTTSSTNFGNFLTGANTKICGAKGYTFDPTWPTNRIAEFQALNTSIDPANPTKNCSALDFVCWVNQAWDSSTKALLEGITFLFVPDTETLQSAFSEMTDSLVETLGFLVYPVQWIMDILNGLYGGIINDQNWGTSFCAIDSFSWGLPNGTFFGENIQIDFCSPLNSTIESAAKIFFPVFISYALIRAFKVKIDEVHAK